MGKKIKNISKPEVRRLRAQAGRLEHDVISQTEQLVNARF